MALFRNTLIYVISGFLPVAANFLLAPIYTKYLLPAEYALVGIATLFQAFLTFFISLSLDGAFSRLFFTYERETRLKDALLSTLLLTVLGTSVLVFLFLLIAGDSFFGILFSNRDFRFSNFGYWVILNTSCNVIFLFFAVLYRNEERLKKYITVNLAFFFVPVIGALTGLIFFKEGALGTVIGRTIGSCLIALVLLAGFFSRRKILFSQKLFSKALKYSLPLIPYQLMFAAFLNLDRIILERKFTPHDFGVYNFAVMVSGLIPIFINAISNALNPKIYRELSQKNDPESVRAFNRFTLLGTSLVICLCAACVVPAMRIIISNTYKDAYSYAATLMLAYLPYAHYLIYALPFFYSGKTKPFPVISFIALVAGLLFNYLLIRHLGLWAVCLSLYIIRGTQTAVTYLFIRKHNFQGLKYLSQGVPMSISMSIILVYNILLFANMHFDWVPVDIINLVPLVILGCFSLTLYRKELVFIFAHSRQLFNMVRKKKE